MSPLSYCPNCGAANSSDSVFCEQCGYKVLSGDRGKPTLPRARESDEIKDHAYIESSYSRSRYPHRGYRRRSSHNGTKIIIVAIFFIIIIIGGTIFLFPKLDRSYHYLGAEYVNFHSYDNPGMTEAEFIIDNAVGGVHIHFNHNQSNELVWIQLRIEGRSDVSIDDASQVETYSYGNRTLFIFNSADRTLPNSQWNDYRYEIDIELSTQIVGLFNIHVSSGVIVFDSSNDAVVKELVLDTTAGEISTFIESTTFINTQESNLIKTVSGNLYTYFTDLDAENSTSWEISSISGSIYLETLFNNEPLTAKQVSFELETISGEITYDYSPYLNYNSTEELSLGYTMNAESLTGSINFVDLINSTTSIELPYTSPNYGFALLNFNLSFNTVSGSITVIRR